jgi:hypothetical protein
LLAGALLDQRLEAGDELLEVVDGQLRVLDVGVVKLVLELVDHGFERLMVFMRAFCTPMTTSPYIWMKRR